jgi:hypothetical protein
MAKNNYNHDKKTASKSYKHLERLDAMIVEAARKGDHNLLGKLVLVRDGCHEGDGGKAKK